MDHYKVSDHGHLYSSFGKPQPDTMYAGGCIFIDHTTGHVHIMHLVNFTTTKTIHAKQLSEKHMLDLGMTTTRTCYFEPRGTTPATGRTSSSRTTTDCSRPFPCTSRTNSSLFHPPLLCNVGVMMEPRCRIQSNCKFCCFH